MRSLPSLIKKICEVLVRQACLMGIYRSFALEFF
ncbi:hypothetical protein O97_01145 [Bartonella henselae str. Zeus]|nr:hypothetical protein Q653_00361 [Bartonella henselae JK 42]ETS15444.1 hypothetical protein Q652_00494 [Bartonella henselae JK 41]KEC57327.1 hypothetical protein O97_01145 [Bartonella henselae str. Zeus]